MSPHFSRASLFSPCRADHGIPRRFAAGLAVLLLLSAAVPASAEEAAARRREAPVAVRRVSPLHPPELVKELVNGSVVLECLVDENGEASSVTVVSESHPGFAAAAEEALQQWEFKPGTIDGVPKAMRVKVPFEFRLAPDQVLGVIAGRPVYAEIADTIIPAHQMPAWPTPMQFYVPRYPAELAGTGKYGKAVVNITIDTEGKVMNPRLVKATYPEFIIPSLVTALKLQFPPQVMADGKKVHVNMDIQFDFKVPSGDKPAKTGAEAKAKKSK
jgi:TonB family protein